MTTTTVPAAPSVAAPPRTRLLVKGAEAIAEAAVRAGCRLFFGYPITPQNEIPEYLSRRLPEVGGTFVQAESEVASINMVYGAASTGARVMTSSSSPGISLMAEGCSYLVGSELPAVIVNVGRGGPGLGDIAPAQGDYHMMTRGLGHGDKQYVVLAPATTQEAVDLTSVAFDVAERYRSPCILLTDGLQGQMMEPVTFTDRPPPAFDRSWCATGKPRTRERVIIRSLYLDPEELEKHVHRLGEKFRRMAENEVRFEAHELADRPELVFCAYGTTARIVKSAIVELRREGIRAGLLRPISLWPFPTEAVRGLVDGTKLFLSVEMSLGQMIEDVRLAVEGKRPVRFFGRTGGVVPTVEEIVEAARRELASNAGELASDAGQGGRRG